MALMAQILQTAHVMKTWLRQNAEQHGPMAFDATPDDQVKRYHDATEKFGLHMLSEIELRMKWLPNTGRYVILQDVLDVIRALRED